VIFLLWKPENGCIFPFKSDWKIMQRTNSPKFEPWHTFVTMVALVIAMQLLSGLFGYLGTHANQASAPELTAGMGVLLLGSAAIAFLTRELLKQTSLLLQQRREARVKISPRRLR
jgi:hypothetical protein